MGEALPTLSYVVGTLDRPEGYARLLRSLVETTPFPWELVVRDGSESGYAGPGHRPNALGEVVAVRTYPPDSLVSGYNRAFARARAPWVLWLNDDAEVMPGTAQTAVAFMERHPEIGMGAIYYQEGPGTVLRVNEYKRCLYGNFGILPRALGTVVGWFGTELESYGCDNRLSFEVLLTGNGIAAVPGTWIIHHVDTNPRKERDSREHRGGASDWLERTYADRLDRIRTVHDRYRHLGGPNVLEARKP